MASKEVKTEPAPDGDTKATDAPAPTEAVDRPTTASDIAPVAVLLLTLATTSYTLQLSVRPLFGPILSGTHTQPVLFIFIVAAALLVPQSVQARQNALLWSAACSAITAVALKPFASVSVLISTDPSTAAAISQAVIGFPAIALGGAVWLQWMSLIANNEEATAWGKRAVTAFTWFSLSYCINYLHDIVGLVDDYVVTFSPAPVLIGISALTFTLSEVARPKTASGPPISLKRFAVVFSALVLLLSFGVKTTPPRGLEILSQTRGKTGLIQVADNRITNPPVRYLRRDSSIVGGTFLKPLYDDEATNETMSLVGQPIQLRYVMQDAVRMAHGHNGVRTLVMGVGSGGSASAFMDRGYPVTIIEPDPAIYWAARTHFDLPKPEKAHLEDPAHWVALRARKSPDVQPFDFVVHDLALSGTMPPQYFSREFWRDLKAIMDPSGIAAITFLGTPDSMSFISALNTLRSVFGKCRAFHDRPIDESPLSPTAPQKMANFIIFCKPGPELTYRPSRADDYKGSAFRESVLDMLIFLQREVNVTAILEGVPPDAFILHNNDPVTRRWGKEIVSDYWKFIRKSLPASVWATY